MKKFLCLLLSIICTFAFVCGCSEKESALTKVEPACLFEESGLLCVQNANGTWDFINTKGEVVVGKYTISLFTIFVPLIRGSLDYARDDGTILIK